VPARADQPIVKRRTVILVYVALAALGAGPLGAARPPAPSTPARASHTKRQAELDVLRLVPRAWKHSRIRDLVDPRSGLLRNNVRAICRGRGRTSRGNGYGRFVCVVRPWPAHGRQELYVTYRVLAGGGFRAHWLRIRQG
jgi:hypothetical protein